MKNIWFNILYYLGLTIVFGLSLGVIFNKELESALIQQYQPKITQESIKHNANKKTAKSYDWGNVKDTNAAKIAQARMNNQQNVVALMTQPKAKTAVTVENGVSDSSLNLSAGTLRPDQAPGKDNYVLAAHHVPHSQWSLFSGIYYYSRPGQNVYVTDLNKVYQYKITNVKFVPATATYITKKDNYKLKTNGIKPGKPMITIISCDATGDDRITEYGTLTKTYEMNDNKMPKEAVYGFNRAAKFDWK